MKPIEFTLETWGFITLVAVIFGFGVVTGAKFF